MVKDEKLVKQMNDCQLNDDIDDADDIKPKACTFISIRLIEETLLFFLCFGRVLGVFFNSATSLAPFYLFLVFRV